jgi:hypothetical protein
MLVAHPWPGECRFPVSAGSRRTPSLHRDQELRVSTRRRQRGRRVWPSSAGCSTFDPEHRGAAADARRQARYRLVARRRESTARATGGCSRRARGHTVGGRASRIARASQALSSSFAAVFPGRCSRRNSGAGRVDTRSSWSLWSDGVRRDPADTGNRHSPGHGCATGIDCHPAVGTGTSTARDRSGHRFHWRALGTRYIEAQLFGVTATDPLTFVGGCVVLAIAGLTASVIPALRAMHVDPVIALGRT